jgi:hypothetical protein
VELSADDFARLEDLSSRTVGGRTGDPGWINRETRALDA